MRNQSTLRIIWTLLAVVALVVVAWLIWANYGPEQTDTQNPNEQTKTDETKPDQPPAETPTVDSSDQVSQKGVTLSITQPKSDQIIDSPLKLTGTVPGSWSNEGSFPVTLVDAEGNQIASGEATLGDDWMTQDQVAFSANIKFSPPASDTGYLVLEKANPSGLDQNNDKFELPVRFR